MSYPTDLSGFSTEPGGLIASEPVVLRGRVLRAPTSMSDVLIVAPLETGEADSYTVLGGFWQASALPDVGDLCPILIDNRGDAWVPMVAVG